MSFTALDVITPSRGIWRERTAGDILTDSLCWTFIKHGVDRIRSIRRESELDDSGERIAEFTITSSASVVYLDARFLPVLIEYLVARGFQADSNLQNHEKRAKAHMDSFESQVRMV